MRLIHNIQKLRFSSLSQIYEQTIKKENMKYDKHQVNVINDLDGLKKDLEGSQRRWKQYVRQIDKGEEIKKEVKKEEGTQPNSWFFSSLFGEKKEQKPSIKPSTNSSYIISNCMVKGYYLYGGSGCGKSFLSDIFYNNLNIPEKKRLHFHEFMAGIHAELFQLERQNKGFDPLITVAKNRAKSTRLLYLDEFQVTDVADASILKRLFERLIEYQMVLLATSNRHPTDLYKRGHQREFFLPFIDSLQKNCNIRHLNSQKDYRYDLQKDTSDVTVSYMTPVDEVSDSKLNNIFCILAGIQKIEFQQVKLEPIKGRQLTIEKTKNNVCFFEFNELVDRVMGDSDFRAISQNFKAIIIRNMRKIHSHERNIANRLIKLFDQSYFRNVKIYISADEGLQNIISAIAQNQCRTQQDFALIRCKSRLIQFQTIKYKEGKSYVERKEEQFNSLRADD